MGSVPWLAQIPTLGTVQMVAGAQTMASLSRQVQRTRHTGMPKFHMKYREGISFFEKQSNIQAATDSELFIRSYDFFDWFWQGRAGDWMRIPEEQHFIRFHQYPIPRAAVPAVTRATQTRNYPYYQQASRDIDPELKSALNARLQAGTHPITRALVPVGLRYVKILGAGTQGVAVLFEMDSDDGITRRVVAKYDTGQEEDPDNLRGVQGASGLLREKMHMRVSEGGTGNLPYCLCCH